MCAPKLITLIAVTIKILNSLLAVVQWFLIKAEATTYFWRQVKLFLPTCCFQFVVLLARRGKSVLASKLGGRTWAAPRTNWARCWETFRRRGAGRRRQAQWVGDCRGAARGGETGCGTSSSDGNEVPHPHANEITDEVNKQKTKTL